MKWKSNVCDEDVETWATCSLVGFPTMKRLSEPRQLPQFTLAIVLNL